MAGAYPVALLCPPPGCLSCSQCVSCTHAPVVSWLQDWDRARLRNKFRVVHTKAGTDKMNSVNRLIDQHGLKALEADQESQDLILRNNLLWTANGNLRCLTASERERLLGFPA
eukprot:COSAG06_NODE_1334_length_9834_cov_2.689985_7_plen_113_part_00